MRELNLLPQEAVIWGDGVLASAIAKVGEIGVERPIVFTIEALKETAQQLLEPVLTSSVGCFTGLPEHALDFGIRHGLKSALRLERSRS